MSKQQIIRRISKQIQLIINLASTDADSPFKVKGYTLEKQEKMVNKLKKRLAALAKSAEPEDLSNNTHLSEGIRFIYGFFNNEILNSFGDDESYPRGWYNRSEEELQQLLKNLQKVEENTRILLDHIIFAPDLHGNPPKSAKNSFLEHVLYMNKEISK